MWFYSHKLHPKLWSVGDVAFLFIISLKAIFVIQYIQDNLRRINTGSQNGVSNFAEHSYVPGVTFYFKLSSSRQICRGLFLFCGYYIYCSNHYFHIQSRTVSGHRSGKEISSKLRAIKYD